MTDHSLEILSQTHRMFLRRLGLSDEIIDRRQYATIPDLSFAKLWQFSANQSDLPALMIPIKGTDASTKMYVVSYAKPESSGDVYEFETAIRPSEKYIPDFLTLSDWRPRRLLLVVEGILFADRLSSQGAYCVALPLPSIWNNDRETWSRLLLDDTRVIIVPAATADKKKGEAVEDFRELAEYLKSRGARVHFAWCPFAPLGTNRRFQFPKKTDVYDAAQPFPFYRCTANRTRKFGSEYQFTANGLVKIVPKRDHTETRLIADFTAKVIRQINFGSADQPRLIFDVEVHADGMRRVLSLPAEQFNDLEWVTTTLGVDGTISPNRGAAEEFVAATLSASRTSCQRLTGIDSLGWHFCDGEWLFVMANAVIGPRGIMWAETDQGNRDSLKVNTENALARSTEGGPILADNAIPLYNVLARVDPSLSTYQFPSAADYDLQDAMDWEVKLLHKIPSPVAVAVLGAVFRSVLGDADFLVHLFGPSGSGKTELAAIALQHFGLENSSRRLPLSWSSTANALMTSIAKSGSVLVVVDDFVPTGSRADIASLNRSAERLVRALGNNAGRSRCNSDGSLKETFVPRSVVLSTGEIRATGFSMNARIVNAELKSSLFEDEDLSNFWKEIQAVAEKGVFSYLMLRFVQWVAFNRDRVFQMFEEEKEAARSIIANNRYPIVQDVDDVTLEDLCHEEASDKFKTFTHESRKLHPRTIASISQLIGAWKIFLQFAEYYDLISEPYAEYIMSDIVSPQAVELAGMQADSQREEDPVDIYLECLCIIFSTKRAHLAHLNSPPIINEQTYKSPLYWGYQRNEQWVPRRKFPGLYLNPEKKHAYYFAEDFPDEESESEDSEEEESKPKDSSSFDEEMELKVEWLPCGEAIGWFCGETIYLDPRTSLAAVQSLLRKEGSPEIPINAKALGKRLVERNVIVERSPGRNTLRRRINFARQEVFHVFPASIYDHMHYTHIARQARAVFQPIVRDLQKKAAEEATPLEKAVLARFAKNVEKDVENLLNDTENPSFPTKDWARVRPSF